MADYSALRDTINNNIVPNNGRQEITGEKLNSVLNSMVDVLGEGYTFLGVATISTNPTTPEGKAYYLAGAAGTYRGFGNIVVSSDEVALLVWDGTAWSKVVSPAASKGVVDKISIEMMPLAKCSPIQAFLLNSNQWTTQAGNYGYLIPCEGSTHYSISSVTNRNVVFAFLKDAVIEHQATPNYATGASRMVVSGANTHSGDVPSDAEYLFVSKAVGSANWTPSSLIIDGYDYIEGLKKLVLEQAEDISEVASSISSLAKSSGRFPCSNSADLNKIIKELYIPTSVVSDLSTIDKVRVYNGFSDYYGLAFYAGANIVVDLRMTRKRGVFIDNGSSMAIVDVSPVQNYADFVTSVNNSVANLYYQPRLAAILALGDNIPMTTAISTDPNSTSFEFNQIISKIYIPESLVSASALESVRNIRVYSGYSNYYGITLYDASYNIILHIRQQSSTPPVGIISQNGAYVKGVWGTTTQGYADYRALSLNVSYIQDVNNFPEIHILENSAKIEELSANMIGRYFSSAKLSPIAKKAPLFRVGNGQITNAAIYPDGTIFAGKSDGSVVKIDRSGNETILLSVTGNKVEWRCFFLDKEMNLYVSPHATHGSLNMADRGLYRLPYGGSSFTKVIALYNSSSSDTPETQSNDDTIWTMCEDIHGYLYAGVYCHSVRYAPRIYRSIDGGSTWEDYYDFLPLLPSGHHVHCIAYNEYNDSLYCIIGEVNTILKSSDQGTTWENLNVVNEDAKGTMLFAVNDGVLIGSDSAWSFLMSKLYSDDKTIKTTARVWANTCFAIRQSDVTGWIYAFGKIDSSVNVTDYFPSIDAISDPSVLQSWKNSSPTYLAKWEEYHDRVEGWYPDDAIRPQHFGILRTMDNGETWEVVYREEVSSSSANGIYCVSEFRNGECLCGRIIGGNVIQPLILSEGKHLYDNSGVNKDGEIFAPLLP